LPLVDLERKSWFRPEIGYAQVATLAAALLLVVSGVLGYALHRSYVAPAVLPPVNLTVVAPPPVAPAPVTPAVPVAPAVLPPVSDNTREDLAAAEARSQALQQQLQAAAAELDSFRSQQQQASD